MTDWDKEAKEHALEAWARSHGASSTDRERAIMHAQISLAASAIYANQLERENHA